jgi:hypothetical protein
MGFWLQLINGAVVGQTTELSASELIFSTVGTEGGLTIKQLDLTDDGHRTMAEGQWFHFTSK